MYIAPELMPKTRDLSKVLESKLPIVFAIRGAG